MPIAPKKPQNSFYNTTSTEFVTHRLNPKGFDEKLLASAVNVGFMGIFIGFGSSTAEGPLEIVISICLWTVS
jgi:hypothetical protein